MRFIQDWYVFFENLASAIVRVGNEKIILAHGKGDISMLSYYGKNRIEKHLKDVLYEPNIQLKLFL